MLDYTRRAISIRMSSSRCFSTLVSTFLLSGRKHIISTVILSNFRLDITACALADRITQSGVYTRTFYRVNSYYRYYCRRGKPIANQTTQLQFRFETSPTTRQSPFARELNNGPFSAGATLRGARAQT